MFFLTTEFIFFNFVIIYIIYIFSFSFINSLIELLANCFNYLQDLYILTIFNL